MLKKLDWYVIGKFLSTFFFTVLIFSMVSLVIDFSNKIERFIESDISKMEIAFEYSPTFLLFILGFLWPMLTLIAVIFFTGRMANNSEIIGILNAGVSFWRLGKTQNVHMFVAPNTKVFMTHFSKRDSSARNFRIEYFQDNKLTSLTKARSARYIKGDTSFWQLSNYEIRTFDGKNERLQLGGRNTLDTAEPFTIFILTLIGVAVAGRKTRGGMGGQLALGIFIGALFVFLSRFASTITSNPAIPVYLGMWMPNIVFFAAAMFFVAKAQR